VGARFFAHVQTGPGAHPASCTMGTGSFPGVQRPGRGADHPPPPSAEVDVLGGLLLGDLYLINGTNFGVGGGSNEQCMFLFSLQPCLHVKYPLFLPDFNETWIDRRFLKVLKQKPNENPFGGSRVVHAYGRTDRHDKAESLFVIIRTRLTIAWNRLISTPVHSCSTVSADTLCIVAGVQSSNTCIFHWFLSIVFYKSFWFVKVYNFRFPIRLLCDFASAYSFLSPVVWINSFDYRRHLFWR
jgi:hypothetical protein